MDRNAAAEVLQLVLRLGLTVRSGPADGGCLVKIIGGRTPATGFGADWLEAFWRASWRWTQS